MKRPYHRGIRLEPLLYSHHPEDRLKSAQAQKGRARRSLIEQARDWPPYSPGAINAWLLLVTTKPPAWRDSLVSWPEAPPTLGEAHEGFFYPDPLGFWAEVRRWVKELYLPYQRHWSMADMLSVTMLVHVGDEPERFHRAAALADPRMIVFLDEPSLDRAGVDGVRRELHSITDPHRRGQVYEGFWGRRDDGVVVGKSPQHPATHNLYCSEDMLGFLRSAPRTGDS